jgi:hypothetical protein
MKLFVEEHYLKHKGNNVSKNFSFRKFCLSLFPVLTVIDIK